MLKSLLKKHYIYISLRSVKHPKCGASSKIHRDLRFEKMINLDIIIYNLNKWCIFIDWNE